MEAGELERESQVRFKLWPEIVCSKTNFVLRTGSLPTSRAGGARPSADNTPIFCCGTGCDAAAHHVVLPSLPWAYEASRAPLVQLRFTWSRMLQSVLEARQARCWDGVTRKRRAVSAVTSAHALARRRSTSGAGYACPFPLCPATW